MKQKIANFISTIGHPLLTIPVFVVIAMLGSDDIENAVFISFLIIGCVFIPLGVLLYLKSKNGTYTNFDVSDRVQRKSLFFYIVPLLIIVTFVLFITGQNSNLCISVLLATVLVIVSQIVNLFIKSSLHVSLNIYLSFMLMMLNLNAGVALLLFTVLLGWSRIILRRHTLKEVLCGGCIGLTIGILRLVISA